MWCPVNQSSAVIDFILLLGVYVTKKEAERYQDEQIQSIVTQSTLLSSRTHKLGKTQAGVISSWNER